MLFWSYCTPSITLPSFCINVITYIWKGVVFSAIQIQIIIISPMTSNPQKKEDLIKELDSALNRKIQQKYGNPNAKTQQISNNTQLKYNAQYNNRQPEGKMYRSKDYFAKSPVNPQQHELKKEYSPEPVRQVPQMERLKGENSMLQAELNHMKNCIKELQSHSRRLKRQESEYSALKEENIFLKREIEFLRSKLRTSEDPKTKQSNYSNLGEIMKKIMMQLSINCIDKHWNEQCVIDSLKQVSRGIYRLAEEKTKLNAKINTFDLEAVLAKENNLTFKREIEEMKAKINAYQQQAEQDQQRIARMEAEFEQVLNQNMRVEAKYRQTYKELESMKKEHRIVVQSYKHRKPKRQTHIRREREVPLEQTNTISLVNTVVTTNSSAETQTEGVAQDIEQLVRLNQQIVKYRSRAIQLQAECQQWKAKYQTIEQQLAAKGVVLRQMEQTNATNSAQIAEQQQKNHNYECYIKELEERCEQITRDIANFMPQLKTIEEENHALRATHAHKDQQLITKMQLVNQLRHENDTLNQQITQHENNHHTLVQQISTTKNQNEQLRQQIQQLTVQYNELQDVSSKNNVCMKEQMEQTQRDIQQQLHDRITQYEHTISNKEQQLRQLEQQAHQQQQQYHNKQQQWDNKQQYYQHTIQELVDNSKQWSILQLQLAQTTETFALQKSRVKQAVQQIIILNAELTKKQTQYQSQQNAAQNRLIAMQNQNNLISQGYYQLELKAEHNEQEINRLKRDNDVLAMTNQNLVKQLELERLSIENMKIELREYCQLNKRQQQQLSNIQYNNAQLSAQISNEQQQKSKLLQAVAQLNHQKLSLEHRLAQLLPIEHAKNQEIVMLQQRVATLAHENTVLHQEHQALRQQAEDQSRRKTEQLSNHIYDLQRLARQNRQLRTQIDQTNYLSQSKQLSHNDLHRQLQTLTQQNSSLAKKYQYVCEQLEVRQRSREEDQYINQLKNKQYCLILRNILGNIVEVTDLETCCDFEQLLEIGAERAMHRKKDIRNEQSLRKKQKELKRDSYLQDYGMEDEHQEYTEPKRYKFGIEINSYEQLLPHRTTPADENQPNRNNTQDLSAANSPRSLIFNLSNSQLKDRQQSRTSRLITQYTSAPLHTSSQLLK